MSKDIMVCRWDQRAKPDGVSPLKRPNWEKIAKRFARSITRFQNNCNANLPDSVIILAYKLSRRK